MPPTHCRLQVAELWRLRTAADEVLVNAQDILDIQRYAGLTQTCWGTGDLALHKLAPQQIPWDLDRILLRH